MNTNDLQLSKRRAHDASLRTYIGQHRDALAAFHSTGDLEQSEWAAKYLQAARMHAETVVELGGQVDEPELQPEAPATVEELPQMFAAVTAEQPKPRQRCPHYRQIREMFAVAREKGLDVSEDARDRMRGAIGMLLGRRIESRADLSASEWAFATNAVRMGRLFW